MIAAIPFPDISPELFSIEIGPLVFALRWYALAYIAGLLIGWWIVVRLVKRAPLWAPAAPPMQPTQVEALLTWIILGVVLGGRLGFVLFYQPAYYLQNPHEIVMIWQGGMAFHGGLTGVMIAVIGFSRLNKLPLLSVADTLAVATPLALFLGRIANFINAELWGRPTDLPWGVIFPGELAQACATLEAPCARHPSQLYEAGLEGLVLGAVLWVLVRRGVLARPGFATGVFFAGYGLARFVVELVRQADPQFITLTNPTGYVVQLGPAGLSMGQLLSLPMILVGLGFILWAHRRGTGA